LTACDDIQARISGPGEEVSAELQVGGRVVGGYAPTLFVVTLSNSEANRDVVLNSFIVSGDVEILKPAPAVAVDRMLAIIIRFARERVTEEFSGGQAPSFERFGLRTLVAGS
jgi:hypothetical protein